MCQQYLKNLTNVKEYIAWLMVVVHLGGNFSENKPCQDKVERAPEGDSMTSSIYRGVANVHVVNCSPLELLAAFT